MKKFLLPLLIGALAASCIDKDYDLSKIDTDNVTIGNEHRFPLATVTVTMKELEKGNTDIQGLFDQADIWLPRPLPGNAAFLNLELSKTDPAYVSTLTDALIVQLKSDPEKLDQVALLICKEYKTWFLNELELPPSVSDELFIATLKEELPKQQGIQQLTKNLASDYLKQLDVEDLKYTISKVGISSDVVDLLTGNLDADITPKPTLHLYGKIISKLPFSMQLKPNIPNTGVDFTTDVLATKAENSISEQPLTKEDLEHIVDGIEILIPVDLLQYYPDMPFQPEKREQVVITLSLIKRGGLSLN